MQSLYLNFIISNLYYKIFLYVLLLMIVLLFITLDEGLNINHLILPNISNVCLHLLILGLLIQNLFS